MSTPDPFEWTQDDWDEQDFINNPLQGMILEDELEN
jgi:hypothetical protein